MTTSLPTVASSSDPGDRRAAARKALLAKKLRAAADNAQAIPRRPDPDTRVLSYQQERVWFMDQFAPGTSSYTIPIRVDLTGPLDLDVLRRSLVEVRRRHEVLRSRFPVDADGNATVVVDDPDAPLPIDIVDATIDDTTIDDTTIDDTVTDAIDRAAGAPFDLATGPVMRVTLIRHGAGDRHVLLICCHHIVGDGWSVDVLLRDLAATYHAVRTGSTPSLPDLPIDYADFARWQRDTLSGPELDRQLTFWTDGLTGVPALELPTDHPRPAQQTFDGAFHEFVVDRDLADRVAALAADHGATTFMTLLAAYQVLLSRHSGQDDFAVGSSSAGRGPVELENVVGMFINMLPLRARLADDPSFAELLERTRRHVLDAFDHADVPFERLVNALGVPRDTSRSPVFQAMFVLQNYELGRMSSAGTSDLAMRWVPMELPATRFDIELHVVEVPRGLLCKFVYNTALFDAATIDRMARRFETLLAGIVAAPERPVSRLPLLDDAERARLAAWNDTGTPRPDAATLTEMVEAQVERTPDAPAVTFGDTTWSFAELNRHANRVAHALRDRGVGPESLVAVCADRSFDLVTAMLGVLKAGGAYVPLDPEYPRDRLRFMLSDAGAAVALTGREHVDLLSSADTDVLVLDDASWRSDDDTNPAPVCGPENAAYVIYTSGSTGRPKGVPNRHRAIVNRLDWMQRTYRLDHTDSVLQKTPAGFDVSVWEFFWPLISGARLVLAEPGGHKDAGYLRDLLIAENITTAHFVPSMLTVFLSEDGADRCRSLRRVICSGEELPLADARRFVEVLPECDLHNLYGPTEAAIDVSAWPVTAAGLHHLTSVPIGAPISNITLHVLDGVGAPTPVGVAGELHIGGVGLARGYHRRPALTAEKFVPDPFSAEPGARLYRTGDLARWRPDGTLDFLGRIDNQVKVRGLRIELGEIEAALRDRPGVRDAAVIVREDTPGDKRLVGYLVGDEDPAGPDAAELRSALKESLPDYMVPAMFVTLEALPLTPNGKLDRAALPAPTVSRAAPADVVAPRTPVERALADIWSAVLGVDDLGIDDDFFDLGGHSLLATQVIAKIKQGEFDRPVGVMDLFGNRTIRELAEFIGQDEVAAGPRRLLYELTPPVPAARRTMSYVCFPYGGGSAIVYQALADALPAGNRLFSVAIPGHDVGLDESPVPFDELVQRLSDEIMERVDGPLCLYGHCGVGNALNVAVALELERRGRSIETLFIGAMFPFARLKGFIGTVRSAFERLRSNKHYADWLKGMGVDTEGIGPEQADRIISNMRADSEAAEEYFSGLLDRNPDPLRAPVVSVVGSEDPVTDYYTERFREWEFITDRMSLVVLDRAGHFFVKHRADELAEIITTVGDVPGAGGGGAGTAAPPGPDPEKGWALLDTYRAAPDASITEVIKPSLGRFLAVTVGQMISTLGSSLAGFAIPLWLYLQTGSVTDLGLLWALSLIFGVITLPFAGTLIDRLDRRKILMAASSSSAVIQVVLATSLWLNGTETWPLYVLIPLSSVARSFQGLAFQSSVPQLVPKQYLGHAMGLAQLSNGFAQLMMPVIAAGVLTVIGIVGVLTIVIGAYAFAVIVLLFVRFPNTLGWRRREPLITAIVGGLRYSWNHRGFRSMIVYFAVANLFLGPALVLVSPLVLSIGTEIDVARIAMAEACGALLGAVTMAVWGGPTERRMRTVLITNCGTGIGFLIMGVQPSLVVIGAGMFLMAMAMDVSQTIYATIVQVKVPQRYHGRVFALNQTISWSTLPIGFAVLAPAATAMFEPLMADGGSLAASVGSVIGVGEGRGIGLAYVTFGVLMIATIAIAFTFKVLRNFDTEVPDSLPDDLVGAQERLQEIERRRRAAAAATGATAHAEKGAA